MGKQKQNKKNCAGKEREVKAGKPIRSSNWCSFYELENETNSHEMQGKLRNSAEFPWKQEGSNRRQENAGDRIYYCTQKDVAERNATQG